VGYFYYGVLLYFTQEMATRDMKKSQLRTTIISSSGSSSSSGYVHSSVDSGTEVTQFPSCLPPKLFIYIYIYKCYNV